MTGSPELLPSAVNMIAALAVVLGGLFLLVHLARRYLLQRQGPLAGPPLVRVLASHPLGVKKSIALVDVPGCVLVLGLSGDRIQMLSRIQDPDVLERVRSSAACVPASFTEHLMRLGLRRTPGRSEE
jgi:flagellar biogenesis protein FliO